MKRTLLIVVSLSLLVALVVLVNPIKTVALDFLSIFRVNDVQTIKITMADLDEGMQMITDLKDEFKGKENAINSLINIVSPPEHKLQTLAGVEDFTSFKLRLPGELASQEYEVSAFEPGQMTFALNVDVCNQLLADFNSPTQLSSNLNNVEMTMKAPASAYVKYDDLLFCATQKSYLEAPDAVKQELREVILELPLIPPNIRQQLLEIEVDSSDIYLPVLVGFGREVDLGGRSGYVYTLADLRALMETFPQDRTEFGMTQEQHAADMAEMKEKMIEKCGIEGFNAFKEAHLKAIAEMSAQENASLLIWSQDGVLYSLMGNKTDAELAEIARSVR